MKTKRNKLVAVLAMLYLAPTSMAQAEIFDGQTVRTNFITVFHLDPNALVFPFDVVVGPETEIVNKYFPASQDRFFSIDFSDTNILITFVSGRPFTLDPIHSINFQDAFGTIPRFTSVTFNPVETTWPGYNYSPRVDPNSFSIGLRGGSPGAQISVDISTMIPEPATGGLMLVSVAFLVTGRRRLAHAACTNLPTSFTVSSY
jgi:hypothetical protein